jgi:hypothetical protein
MIMGGKRKTVTKRITQHTINDGVQLSTSSSTLEKFQHKCWNWNFIIVRRKAKCKNKNKNPRSKTRTHRARNFHQCECIFTLQRVRGWEWMICTRINFSYLQVKIFLFEFLTEPNWLIIKKFLVSKAGFFTRQNMT